jgi:hypothetical protein
VAVAAFGQTATMTSPAAGASWAMGTQQTISWNWKGNAAIKLVLVQQNGAKVGVIKSGLQLSAGSYSWKVGTLEAGTPPPAGGNYRIRISTMDSTIIHAGPVFSILTPATPMQQMLLVHPVMALAIIPAQPPATATFAIKKVTYEFESMGKLRFVDVLVSVSSPLDFSISPSYGDPQYGAQWISYEIFNPAPQQTAGVWIADVFSGTFSVKGGGASKVFSHFPTAPVPAGNREYILSFKPLYNGQAKGVGTMQKKTPGVFEPGGLCLREYYPKMEIQFTAHTAKGPVKASSTVYLIYDRQVWPIFFISLPGETSLCASGIQNW